MNKAGSASRAAAVLIFAALAAGAKPAAGEDKGPPDQSGYSVRHPVPEDKLRDLCVDRPTKGTSACTLDPGHWQVEADLFNGAFQHAVGVTTDTWLLANPTLKLGITDRVDIEVNLPLAEAVRTHDRTASLDQTAWGVGDLVLKSKIALHGNAGSPVAVALLPYLKIPTARLAIGNGAVEGGVLLPVSAVLPANVSLNFVTEADVLKDATGKGDHLQTVNLVGLTRPVASGVSLSAELWSSINFDPGGTVRQYSFDVGVAWVPKTTPNLQFDAGVNFGLNHATPGAQVYAGMSRRF